MRRGDGKKEGLALKICISKIAKNEAEKMGALVDTTKKAVYYLAYGTSTIF